MLSYGMGLNVTRFMMQWGGYADDNRYSAVNVQSSRETQRQTVEDKTASSPREKPHTVHLKFTFPR